MTSRAKRAVFLEKNQTAWQMVSIQLAGWTSLPILASSIILLEKNSFLGSILTIIVANAILWFIRLGILAMGHKKRQSTLDLAKEYFGKLGSYFIAILLLISTVAWFMAQTTTASHSLVHLSLFKETHNIDHFTRISVMIGTLSALFCMGGMKALRQLTVILFPFILISFLVALFLLPRNGLFESHHPLSFSGLTLLLATNLGVTSDLPTFFRHSKSWATSVKALTIIQIASICLGICSLYFGSIILNGLQVNQETIANTPHLSLKLCLAIFVFLSVICANVANVYSSSVGWELVAPKSLVGKKEYFLMGMGLTTLFILVSNLFSLELLLTISDSALVNLCLTLLAGFLLKARKEITSIEKNSLLTAWLFSSSINTLQILGFLLPSYSTVLISTFAIFMTLLPILSFKIWTSLKK